MEIISFSVGFVLGLVAFYVWVLWFYNKNKSKVKITKIKARGVKK